MTNPFIYYYLEVTKQLIDAIIDGNRQAYSELYDIFSDRGYNMALTYTKSHQEAEEITQDVFVKIFQNVTKFEQKSALSTWVYRITINTSLNYIRKKKRFSFLQLFTDKTPDQPDFEHPGVLLENKENAKALYRVMDTLPDTQKTAFILSYIEELPRKEVAQIMEISLKAVESLLQRAKKNMRKKLEKQYPNRGTKKG